MTQRHELETPEDRAAYDLCLAFGFEPFTCVQIGERRCAGYEGDYYMNWARDRVDEFIAIRATLSPGQGTQTEKS